MLTYVAAYPIPQCTPRARRSLAIYVEEALASRGLSRPPSPAVPLFRGARGKSRDGAK